MAALRLADARGSRGSRRCECGQSRGRGHGHAARWQRDCSRSQVDSIATVWQGRRNKEASCWHCASKTAALLAVFASALSCSTTAICSSAECWSCCFCISTCFPAARGCATATCWCTACFASCAAPCAASGSAAGASVACKEARGSCTHPLWPRAASLAAPCAGYGSAMACCSGAIHSGSGCRCELVSSGGFSKRLGGAARRLTHRAWPSLRVAGRDADLGGQTACSPGVALAGIRSAGMGDRGGVPDVRCPCGVRLGAGRGTSRHQSRLACIQLFAHGGSRRGRQEHARERPGLPSRQWSRPPWHAAMPCEAVTGRMAVMGAREEGGWHGRKGEVAGWPWLVTCDVRVRVRPSCRLRGRGAPFTMMTRWRVED